MAGVVDTSVLYGALDELDPQHGRAGGQLRSHRGIEIPSAVLAELELLVRKRSGRPKAMEMVSGLLSRNPHMGVMDVDLHPQALDIWRRNGGISYIDAHAIAGALLLDAPLVTLDRRQRAVWGNERRGPPRDRRVPK